MTSRSYLNKHYGTEGTNSSLLKPSKIPIHIKYLARRTPTYEQPHEDSQPFTNAPKSMGLLTTIPIDLLKNINLVKNARSKKRDRKLNKWRHTNKNQNMRVTRATSKFISKNINGNLTLTAQHNDNMPSISSYLDQTAHITSNPVCQLILYRHPVLQHQKKTLKRKCKNTYYSMSDLADKYDKSEKEEHSVEDSDMTTSNCADAEAQHSDNSISSNSDMEVTYSDNTISIFDTGRRSSINDLNMNIENVEEIQPVNNLDDTNIFESDADDEDKIQQSPQTSPHKPVNKLMSQPPKTRKKMMNICPVNRIHHIRDESLRSNPVRRQLFQIQCNIPKKRQKPSNDEKPHKSNGTKSDSSKPAPTLQCKQRKLLVEVLEDDDNVIEIESQLGRMIFANLAGLQWWPGLIVKGSMCHLYTESRNCSWVYWFGDHKVSLVPQERIIPFAANFNEKFHGKGKMFVKALTESIRVFCERMGLVIDSLSDEFLLAWVQTEFRQSHGSQISKAESVTDIPEWILKHLSKIGDDIIKKVAGKPAPKSKNKKQNDTDTRENAIEAVREGRHKIKDVCIACSDLAAEVIDQHPLFKGGVCQLCKTDILETMYAVDEDDNNAFCSVCGRGGTLFLCDNEECHRVYCVGCVDEMTDSDTLEKIEKAVKWKCFICTPYHASTHGLIQPNHDWPQRIVQFFEAEITDETPNYDLFINKRPIRVLSVFDGIGTGIVVLKELGLEIEEYFASEIEPDAVMVTSVHHGDQVKQIGDVTAITENIISKMLPLDLLIGGSPCNDLSIANPDKKGFEFGGTGILFFEFVRILDMIKKLQGKDNHLFWMYENVASMRLEYKKVISRFLKCPAARWDARYFSAQHRSRYFWGNIPGLYSTPSMSSHTHKNITLNSLLSKKCNREATVDKLRTVTTRTNSLRLGKDDKGFPVKMDGVGAGIWIPELERVFGFPSHYTDVSNLPSTKRQKLLGKAWSVTALKNILMPLKQYFACKVDEES